MGETLEHHEHAAHAAAGGRKYTALAIALLAASLAFAEQGAQHANTTMSQDAIEAADLWAQYQAKSIRATASRQLADLAATMTTPDPAARDALVARLRADEAGFENDPAAGKKAIAAAAKRLEQGRDAAHERLDAFDNAAATLQLAIVLFTASVITGSALLIWAGGLLGVAGVVLAVLGLAAPGLASF
jgi:small-conductance mechanosensitive channel